MNSDKGSSITCPENYLAVSPLSGFTTEAFCVSKYEMIDVANVPTSTKEGTPWTFITHVSAEALCEAIGDGYELISNNQWQTIARQIADIDENWAAGIAYTVGNSGYLNDMAFLFMGNSEDINGDSQNSLLSAGEDNEPCFGYTSLTCNDGYSAIRKRTHKLPSGEVIWDFSGNASEWVKGNQLPTGGDLIASTLTYQINEFSSFLTAFGNDEICDQPTSGNYYFGLGKIYLANDPGATMDGGIRGGSFNSEGGVFSGSVQGSNLLDQPNAWTGFRCVYSE